MPQQLDPVDVSRSIPAGITLLGRLVSLGGGPLAAIGAVVVLTGFIIEYTA